MINFLNHDIFYNLKGKRLYKKWIKEVVKSISKEFEIGDINVVFCTDNYILEVNNQYLKHNYYTDIITFDNCDGSTLSGDLVISLETVEQNSLDYSVSFIDELNRVIIHGVLHLAGFKDETDIEIREMRIQEEKALQLFSLIKNGSN
ncbi:Endoribonuclease YbeY [bioreactor metagenome]|uniref:Endoribonuclease YbeY n=1 Tax=bioreactor metagenome TaxID=1076179 RepID=A0A644WP16_9ZZZZ|nr:rRNA maturation RNase YbeY [Rikenellaceae bacterium]